MTQVRPRRALMLTYTPVPQSPDGFPFVTIGNVFIDGVTQKLATRDVRNCPRRVVAVEQVNRDEFPRVVVTLRTSYPRMTRVDFIDTVGGYGCDWVRDVDDYTDDEYEPEPWDIPFYLEAFERQFRF